jgi:hypothetical protein
MKVSSDGANVSPLDTWLREGENADAAQAREPLAAAALAAPTESAPTLYDSAEGLLSLDVWSGLPAPDRALTASSSSSLSGNGAASTPRDWAEHVIEPLLN